jgi:orotidine-5'-phosphate decarboxylase
MDRTLQKPIIAAKDRIFPALDVNTLDEAKRLMDALVGLVTHVKFGLQLATAESWGAGITAAHERGFKVFCDAKFKDIPHTVEHAARALTYHRPDFFTVMADTSMSALVAIRSGVDTMSTALQLPVAPKIIGVTVLTSIDNAECQTIYGDDAASKTLQFGTNIVTAGLDAIVCSPEDISLFRSNELFHDTLIITPGVRPAWAASNDQQRMASPGDAIARGADMLVIGRPITQPPPEVGTVQEAIKRIIAEIEEATR